MGLGALFGRNKQAAAKDRLIRALVKKRLIDDPMAVAAGYGPEKVDSLPEAMLIGFPEATIVSIVEAYSALSKRGVGHLEILSRIEAHRSTLGSGELPNPATIENYIGYRLALEHAEAFVLPHHVHDCILLTQRLFPYEEPAPAPPNSAPSSDEMPLSPNMPDVTQRPPMAIYAAGRYALLLVENARALAERVAGDRMPIDYRYVLTALDRGTMRPRMFVTLERKLAALDSESGSHFLCVFEPSGAHTNLGDGSALIDVKKFTEIATARVCKTLGIDPRAVCREA